MGEREQGEEELEREQGEVVEVDNRRSGRGGSIETHWEFGHRGSIAP